MAVIDPSDPDAGNKEGIEGSEKGLGVIHLLAGGLSLLRSGRSSTASRCRSRSAGFLLPTEALTPTAHDATEMQQIRADVEARCLRGRVEKLEISRVAMSSLAS